MATQSFEDARKNDFMAFTVIHMGKEYHGYFSNVRIDRRTVPTGWHVYDLRDGDETDLACELKNAYIIVNHFGTFATQDPLPLKEGESLYFTYDENDKDGFDYSFDD